MQILNFAHPLTEEQLSRIEELAGAKITGVINIDSQIDTAKPIEEQIAAMLDRTGLTSEEWQTKPLLVNLPSLNYSAAAMLAQLHGRMGYFPPILRLRPVTDSIAPRFEAAEILNLQAMRERAREKR
ncbi:MAG: CRISPR-associated protein Csx15 [Dethiobacteria bacterium]|jgi:hypothetical protein|nr:hypothetical protein [Bacillota bacterium]HOP69181.1 CRISPR-associated protein Csx15 [Bacillota bacterium]HPT34619.1 CRISPR-associated protein Csx15 [Bacillota bacterium]HQD06600.1 CRISPR-associated protein Csx15 [Bacillota bacterium]